MGISLDGLGGFPTAGIIEKLMAIESRRYQPYAQRKSQVDVQTRAMQELNSKFANLLKDSYAILGKEDKFSVARPEKAWQSAVGKSSHPSVEIKTKEGANIGNLEFFVKQTAVSKQAVMDEAQLQSFSDKFMSMQPPAISLIVGNKVTSIKPASGSAQDMAKAINAARDVGVYATAVRVGDGKYVLQITGRQDGDNTGDFKLVAGDLTQGFTSGTGEGATQVQTDASGATTVTFKDEQVLGDELNGKYSSGDFANMEVKREAREAIITLWPKKDQSGNYVGQDIRSSSNTFKDLFPGVDVIIGKEVVNEKGENIENSGIFVKADVAADPTGITDKVMAMVNSFNTVVDQMADGMKSRDEKRPDGTTWKAPGVFGEISLVRQLRNNMRSLMSSGVNVAAEGEDPRIASLSKIGITISGKLGDEMKLSFDKEKFKTMVTENPIEVEKIMTGFAEKVSDFAMRTSDSTEGSLTEAIKAQEEEKQRLDKDLKAFTDRLERRRADMERQFASLQTILQQSQAQGAWLQSQIAQLPKASTAF